MILRRLFSVFVLLVVTQVVHSGGTPQGTAFNYQGVLKTGGSPYSGTADFEFRLFDSAGGATQIGAMIPYAGVMLTDGLFATPLDFGVLAFAGEERWLEVRVRTPAGGGGGFTTLTPRQKVQTLPYAAFALASGAVGSGGLSGTYPNEVSFTNVGNAFAGNGSGLTNLNASNLASGTLADGRLSGTYSGALTLSNPANVLAGNGAAITNLNAANLTGVIPNSALSGTYSGALTFSNSANSFAGSGAGLTSLNASSVTSGTLDNARLSESLLAQIPDNGVFPTLVGSACIASGLNTFAIAGTVACAISFGTSSLYAIDVAVSASPSVVGQLVLPLPPLDVARAGNFAYIVAAPKTLYVVDLSNPAQPLIVGSVQASALGATLNRIVVQGTVAYVADTSSGWQRLRMFNVSNPQSPIEYSGSVYIPPASGTGVAGMELAVSGTFVYIVRDDTTNSILRVCDVSDVGDPTLVGSLVLPKESTKPRVSGNRVFVVDVDDNLLQVVDISNPAFPSLAGQILAASGGWTRDVAIVGERAIVIGGYPYQMQVFDVADPSTMTLTAGVSMESLAAQIEASGGYAYVLRSLSGAGCLDVYGLMATTEFGDSTVLLSEGIIGSGSGLTNLDASNLASGVLADGRLSGTYSSALTLSNPANVLAGNGAAITNLNAANLTGVIPNSALAGTYTGVLTFSNAANSFAGSGAGLTNLNASNIESGTLDEARLPASLLSWLPDSISGLEHMHLAGTASAALANDVAVSGGHAYVVTPTSLLVFDITDTQSPVLVGSIAVGGHALALYGNYAYLYGGTLYVIDVSNPVAPAIAGSIVLNMGTGDVAVAGNHVYVIGATADALQAVNVSNPQNPTLGNSASTAIDPVAIAISGDVAYVAANTNDLLDGNLQRFSITVPGSPSALNSVNTDKNPVGVVIVGNHAYVATDGNQFQSDRIATRDATTLALIGEVSPGFNVRGIAASTDALFCCGLGRLAVYGLSDPDVPTLTVLLTSPTSTTDVAVDGDVACLTSPNPAGLLQVFTADALAFNFPITSESFSGSGANLQNLDAANISSGQLSFFRFPTQGHWGLINDLSINEDTLAIEASLHRVGIGTDAPAQKLHVEGTAAVTESMGIGTTSPVARLDVVGAGAGPVLFARTPSDAQGRRSVMGFYSTFQNTADNGARRTADLLAGFNGGAWGTEYLAFHVGNNGAANDAATLTSEKLRITSGGSVGINTTTPADMLHVRGGVTIEGGDHIYMQFYPDGYAAGRKGWFGWGSASDNNLSIANEITDAHILLSPTGASGRVGISRTPTANKLEVEGNASKSVSGSWLANSDARIKTDVQTVASALDTLDRVRLVSFNYTPEYLEQHPSIEDRRYLNIIAQEFAQVFPEHVRGSGEFLPGAGDRGAGEEILQVDIHPLTIYAAAAIQELHAKVKALAARPTVQGASASISREEVSRLLAQKDAEIAAIRSANAELTTDLVELRALVQQLIEDKE